MMTRQEAKWSEYYRCCATSCTKPATWTVAVGRHALLGVCDTHVHQSHAVLYRKVEGVDRLLNPPQGWTVVEKSVKTITKSGNPKYVKVPVGFQSDPIVATE